MKNKSIKLLNNLSSLYLIILILIFPLIHNKNGFFQILEAKWNFYLVFASIYSFINIAIILFLRIKGVKFKEIIKLTKIHYALIIFMIVCIISTLFSPYRVTHNLLVGVGRGEGLMMMLLYSLSFMFLSLFLKFKKEYILYFSISSIILNTIATLQYVGFNPFNMYQDGIGTHNVSFMITIGNIDFISAMYTILLSVSIGAFIFLDEKKTNKIIHLISFFLGFFILGIINVLSGKVAFLSILLIFSPFIISNNKRLSRFLVFISTFLMSYCANIIINPEYHYELSRLKLCFQFNYLVVLFIVVCSLIYFLAYKLYKTDYDFSNNKKIIKLIYVLIFGFIVVGLIGIYFINFKSGTLYEMHELLHGNFDDNFGTYRIFLWKRTLKIFPEYPIIGSGPDTFAIRFMDKFTKDVAMIGPLSINDTAANVYLTMLINIGLLGLISYVAFLVLQLIRYVKSKSIYTFVLLIPFICYIIQDFFNLSVVIVTPIFWGLMGLIYSTTNIDR